MKPRPIHYIGGLRWHSGHPGRSGHTIEEVAPGDAPCPSMRWRPRALGAPDPAAGTTDETLVTCKACLWCLARRGRN